MMHTSADLSVLTRYPTPAVANALELFDLRGRDRGFLRPGLRCLMPGAAPMAGYAATCLVSAEQPDSFGRQEPFAYWEHLESIPSPRIAVFQDIDPVPGVGSAWGEVNANIHLALGCRAVVTNGGVRDLEEMRAAGFQALHGAVCVSHAYVHTVAFGCPVSLYGATVRPGDLLQVDRHGVLLIPPETLPRLEEAIREVEKRERAVIDYCRSGQATRAGLQEKVLAHLRNLPRMTPRVSDREGA